MPDLIDWLVENDPAFRKSRLPSLYSDLTVQKTTNPEGYAANVAAWQNALTRAAIAGQLETEHRLTLQTSEELLNALASPQYGRPSGLGLVLDDAVGHGRMYDLKDFKNAEQSIYHSSWIPSPISVLRWGLKQAGLARGTSYNKSGSLRPGQLVLVSALEDASKQIMAVQSKKSSHLTDRIMTREAFVTNLAKVNGQPLSPQDVDILLCYLSRDKEVLSYDSKAIKFNSPNSEKPESVTTEDIAIANLKTLMQNLQIQITNLEARISTLQTTAKNAVASKNKVSAMSALRSKKLAEKTLSQRTDTMMQLEEVFAKIEQAVDQVQILDVMESSTSLLKNLNKKIGSVERVEDVIDGLREEMGKVDEVGQVLQEPLDATAVLDEADIDDELEQMEKEAKKKEEEREAEATRKRLAELEQTEKQKQQEEQDRELESALSSSMERLEKLDLSNAAAKHGEETAREERVPEQAT